VWEWQCDVLECGHRRRLLPRMRLTSCLVSLYIYRETMSRPKIRHPPRRVRNPVLQRYEAQFWLSGRSWPTWASSAREPSSHASAVQETHLCLRHRALPGVTAPTSMDLQGGRKDGQHLARARRGHCLSARETAEWRRLRTLLRRMESLSRRAIRRKARS